jgi:hypothetical protein
MKGGFYKEYSEEDFEHFVSPHVKGIGDCCPCAFRMLNIINDDDFKSMTKNFKKRGNWYGDDMENFFRKKYNDFEFSWVTADFRKSSSILDIKKTLKELIIFIKPGYAIIGGVVNILGQGHCVVLFKNKNGKVFILDAISKKKFDSLTRYINMHRIIVLNFLFSYHKVTNEALTLNKDFEMDDSLPDESSDALYYSAEESSFSNTFYDALSDSPVTEL